MLAGGMSLCFLHFGFAQSKSSYEDRLSQIAGKESDRHLGTISGRDKNEQRKKELFEAYTYVPRDAVKEELFNKDYVDFRNEHKVPNYIGDDKAKEALKKAKDEALKTEVVKIVEAEKLLHDTFQAYHEEKTKTELESNLLKTIGNKKDTGLDKQKKEMDERIDIIGDKTASILNTSIQKLSTSNLINEPESREVYMASGGRVFPKLSMDEDKDFLNVRSKVMDRVQKDLMTALASAINEFYHVEQKETAKAEIEKKEQLLAFVRVEDKAEGRDINKVERIQAIQEFISKMDRSPKDSSSEGKAVFGITQERIDDIKQKFAELIKVSSGEDKARFERMADTFNRETDPQSGKREKFYKYYDPIGGPRASSASTPVGAPVPGYGTSQPGQGGNYVDGPAAVTPSPPAGSPDPPPGSPEP